MFGVLNHCEDWERVIGSLESMLAENGKIIISLYGSPESIVFDELKNGLSYEPAILVRRTEGGLLLGEDAKTVLPTRFPYPKDVANQLEASGLKIESTVPFLITASLYPRDPTPQNIDSFLRMINRLFGSKVCKFLRDFAAAASRVALCGLPDA
jgi:hypothetical protein